MTTALVVAWIFLAQAEPVPRAEVVPQPAKSESIERAVTAMKEAQSKLAEGKTGTATQDLQKQALAALDELLKTPPKPSPNQSGQGGGQSQSSSSSSSSQSQSQQQKDSQSSAQRESSSSQQEAQRQAAQERERAQAEESEERSRQRRGGAVAPLPRRRLEVDVWGHLPEKVRDQLLNGYGERIVPQYEAMVRKFYESMADTAAESDTSLPSRRP